MTDSPPVSGPSPESAGAGTAPVGLGQILWRDPILRLAFLGVGVCIVYLLAVVLLHPAWGGPVTDWLLALLAWPELLGVLLFTRWLRTIERPDVLTWSLLSVALLCYALARTLWLVGDQVLSLPNIPYPWWSDLLFLLQALFVYPALLLVPSAPDSNLHGLARLRVFLDSVLLMGAMALLFWYILLEPLVLQGQHTFLAQIADGAYVLVDLGLLFVLIYMLLYAKRPEVERIVLGLWIAAAILVFIANLWYVVLHQPPPQASDTPAALFWFLGYLLVPLAGLVAFRLTHDVAPLRRARPVSKPLFWQDILNSLRFFLPFVLAFLVSIGLLVWSIVVPSVGRNPIPPWIIGLGFVALVIVRQWVVYLEHVRLRREREEAQTREQALREANRQLETFLGIASHELKTPLTSVLMGLQRIQRRVRRQMSPQASEGKLAMPEGEVVQALAETTLQQGARLNRLVNDLIDTSCIQAGQLAFHFERGDLVGIVRSMVEEQRQAAPERTISLSLSVASLPVCADPDRIGQVVTNYLTNALKYSPEERPVEVGVQQEGLYGRVWVRDQGPGIPLVEQEHLWERFHRVSGIEVQSGSGIGLGLGLHICKTIIERHQGQVGVESRSGGGSTFWFTLPLVDQAEAEEAELLYC